MNHGSSNRSDESAAQLDAELLAFYQAIPVPYQSFDALRAQLAPAGGLRKLRPTVSWSRPLAVALAGVAVTAAAVFGSTLWPFRSGSPAITSVEAQVILQRSSAAAAVDASAPSASPYHLVAHETSNGKGGGWTETWFEDAAHFRTETWVSGDRSGAPTFGESRDGSDVWLFASDGGTTRAAHGSAAQLGVGVDQVVNNAQSLSQLLDSYANGGCFQAERKGTDTVLGRTALVVEVVPVTSSCSPKVKDPSIATAMGATTTVWVDEQTFLPLRTRMALQNDSRVLVMYEVTQLEIGSVAPAADFRYQPPADARVAEVTSAAGAKAALRP